MRIWLAASVSPSSPGGVYRSITGLAMELQRRGHTTRTIFSSPGRAHKRHLFSCRLALRLFFFFWKRPDWIIARSSDGLACALVARLFRMKTAIALHNHGWEERAFAIERRLPSSVINNPTTWRGRIAGFFLLRLTLKKTDLCLCGTIDEARWLSNRYPGVRPKLCIVPNGVPSVAQAHWPLQEEFPPSILMAGAFTWKKNLLYGVELFRRLLEKEEDARLFIVGCGPLSPQQKGPLHALGDAVFIVENEAPDRMSRWYESCPMLLLPSRYEGGRPFTILEAQSRGCTVFASDIAAIRECVTHGKTGFLLSGVNPVADAGLIASVFRNRELMRSVGQSAWKKAMRNSIKRQGERCIAAITRRYRFSGRINPE